MSERRSLAFATLHEVMPDVDRLLAGYRSGGNWTLGQVCNHLARVLVFTIEGSPEHGPHVLEERARLIMTRRLLSSGVMAEGLDVPGSPLPGPGLDDRVEAQSLRQAIDRFLRHPGPFAAHPLLGAFQLDQVHRFQCVHCAHHLSHIQLA